MQHAARAEVLGGRWQLGGHFKAQQRFSRVLAGRCAQGLNPAAAHGGRDDFAQFLRGRQLLRVALFPRGQQVGQHFAVRLHGELFQRMVGGLKGFALGTEGGIAQARAALFEGRTLAETIRTAFTLGAVRLELVVGALARAAGLAARTRVLAVAKLAATASSGGGFGLAGAGAVVAAHGDNLLG